MRKQRLPRRALHLKDNTKSAQTRDGGQGEGAQTES